MGCEFRGPVGGIVALDKAVNGRLARLRRPLAVRAAELVTILGSGPLCVTIYIVLFLSFGESCRKLINAVVTAEILELSVIIPLRYLAKRERPRPRSGGRLFAGWNRYSFPSLHASRAFMLAMVIGTHWQAAAPYSLAAALAIGFTRIFLERHYLSDVLAGAGIGGLMAAAALRLTA